MKNEKKKYQINSQNSKCSLVVKRTYISACSPFLTTFFCNNIFMRLNMAVSRMLYDCATSRKERQQNLCLYLSNYIFKLFVRGGSSIMDVAFGLILSKVTTSMI